MLTYAITYAVLVTCACAVLLWELAGAKQAAQAAIDELDACQQRSQRIATDNIKLRGELAKVRARHEALLNSKQP